MQLAEVEDDLVGCGITERLADFSELKIPVGFEKGRFCLKSSSLPLGLLQLLTLGV